MFVRCVAVRSLLAAAFCAAVVGPLASPARAALACSTDIGGSISDGNGGPLSAGVYHVTNELDVPKGATLTVSAGAILKFEDGLSFQIFGTLNVQGSGIVFTSIYDDTVGGDTNLDGGATQPNPGDWNSVIFWKESDASSVYDLTIRYTGSNGAAVQLHDTDAEFQDVTLEDGAWYGFDLDSTNSNPDPKFIRCAINRCRAPIVSARPEHLDNILDCTATGNLDNDYISLTTADLELSEDADLSPRNLLNNVIVGEMRVPYGVALTLRAGVVWKFRSLESLAVGGSLVVDGTAGMPVVFTSIKDDTQAGDTNHDGNASSPAPGDWYFVSTAQACDVRYAVIRYGGQNHAASLSFFGYPRVLLDSTIEFSGGAAIDYASVTAPLTVERCVFRDNEGVPHVGLSIEAVPGLRDNSAFRNQLGNRFDARVIGAFDTPVVVDPSNLYWDWVTDTRTLVLVGSSGGGPFTIGSGGSLTIRPGIVVKMQENSSIALSGGALIARGTPGRRIVFTSEHDDTVGDDLNNDASTNTPAPGDWGGISFNFNTAASELENVHLRYGGDLDGAQLYSNSSALKLKNVISQFSRGHGFNLLRHSGTARNLIADSNGADGVALGSVPVRVSHSTSAYNTGYGFSCGSSYSGSLDHCVSWNNSAGNYHGFDANEIS